MRGTKRALADQTQVDLRTDVRFVCPIGDSLAHTSGENEHREAAANRLFGGNLGATMNALINAVDSAMQAQSAS